MGAEQLVSCTLRDGCWRYKETFAPQNVNCSLYGIITRKCRKSVLSFNYEFLSWTVHKVKKTITGTFFMIKSVINFTKHLRYFIRKEKISTMLIMIPLISGFQCSIHTTHFLQHRYKS